MYKRMSRILVESIPGFSDVESKELDEHAVVLEKTMEKLLGSPRLPTSTETVGISFLRPKTAALFFDRVWALPFGGKNRTPEEIMVYGGTDLETVLAMLILSGEKQDKFIDMQRLHERINVEKFRGLEDVRAISESLFQQYGFLSSPIYESVKKRHEEYQLGSRDVICCAVSDIPIIEEGNLEWSQVMEFRRDHEAHAKYRRMIHWLDSEMVGKPASFISDRIAAKLEDYEWALRKHGIEWKRGILEGLLDPKFLPAASASMAALAYVGDQFWAALGGISLMIGKVAFSASKTVLDLEDVKRGKNSEIAFVHEIKEKLGNK